MVNNQLIYIYIYIYIKVSSKEKKHIWRKKNKSQSGFVGSPEPQVNPTIQSSFAGFLLISIFCLTWTGPATRSWTDPSSWSEFNNYDFKFLVYVSKWTLLIVPTSSALVGMPYFFLETLLLVLIRYFRHSTIILF
jgi:hypothetical protein